MHSTRRATLKTSCASICWSGATKMRSQGSKRSFGFRTHSLRAGSAWIRPSGRSAATLGSRSSSRARKTQLRSFAIWLVGSLAPWLPGSPAHAQREPVLKQIHVPHSYYYREMYLPQATSGPSSAAWSPDGEELVYSMQGTLWRQRLGTTEAVQLTD